MKIHYLSESPFPSPAANTVQVMQMCSAMARLGHSVVLVCRRPRRAAANATEIFAYYDLPPQFRVLRIPFAPVPGKKYLWAILAAVRARLAGADLVYGRSARGCYYAARFGLPVIYEAHKPLNSADSGEVKCGRRLFRAPRLIRLIVLSRALAARFAQCYDVAAERIRVVYNGAADPRDVAPLQALWPLDRSFTVGYAGSLYPGKGIELIAAIAPHCPWARFVVAGGSEDEVQNWRSRLAAADNVTFLGNLAQQQLPAFRAAMDVLLVPPRATVTVAGGGQINQGDAPPLKLYEAMAAGKAIVCSDYLAEVVSDGVHALLRDPERPDDWIAALQQLHHNPALRQQLAQRARALYHSGFSWTARATKVLQP